MMSKSEIERTFLEACHTVNPGQRLLLGCSAGGDSMTLLDLCARFRSQFGWELAVVHLDHAQRPESFEEARFVMKRTTDYGLPCFVKRLSRQGELSEAQMRQERHLFFKYISEIWNANAILLAHHANDKAETFLIRLMTGSGPVGLSSIRMLESVPPLGTIFRPLLKLYRSQLREHLQINNLTWHEDSTNQHTTTQRGWVRNQLMPILEQRFSYDPAKPITRSAELIMEEAAVLREAIGLILEELRVKPNPLVLAQLNLSKKLWRNAKHDLKRQIIREWLWLMITSHPPGFEATEEVLKFIESNDKNSELRTVNKIYLRHHKPFLFAFSPEIDLKTRFYIANNMKNSLSDYKTKPK